MDESIWLDHLMELDGPVFHVAEGGAGRLDLLSQLAERKHLRVFTLILSAVNSLDELMDTIARDLSFPGQYGKNWNALLDMVSDLSWWSADGFVLVLDNSAHLLLISEEAFTQFFEVIDDAAERMRRRQVLLKVVLVGEVPRFELETAVGVLNVCDDNVLGTG